VLNLEYDLLLGLVTALNVETAANPHLRDPSSPLIVENQKFV
jgi:hypothetical protein